MTLDAKKQIFKNLEDLKALLRTIAEDATKSSCFFHHCDKPAIKSHSLSESRVLSKLESKGDTKAIVLYHLDDSPEVDYRTQYLSSFKKTKRTLVAKGKGDTSTYHGFCHDHDSSIFDLIDNRVYSNTAEVNFLHSLRAHSYHYVKSLESLTFLDNKLGPQLSTAHQEFEDLVKQEGTYNKVLEVLSIIPDEFNMEWNFVKPLLSELPVTNVTTNRNDVVDSMKSLLKDLLEEKNYPMVGRQFRETFIKVISDLLKQKEGFLSLEDIRRIELHTITSIKHHEFQIKELSSIHQNMKYESFKHCHIWLSGFYPITGCFIFMLGEEIMSLTFFPESETEKTHFVFGAWNCSEKQAKFLAQLNIMPENEFVMAVSDIILNQGSNVYLSPRFWDRLNPDQKSLLLEDKKELCRTSFNLFATEFKDHTKSESTE